jgi:hypothetical protein
MSNPNIDAVEFYRNAPAPLKRKGAYYLFANGKSERAIRKILNISARQMELAKREHKDKPLDEKA